ncbi:hypothetical protein, partial [Paenibacillus mesophilus]|uniref:hypothetical protein n=1 Tax=Paenibacillus mesophilus TaxID=2582849 RepID=UPI001EE4024A
SRFSAFEPYAQVVGETVRSSVFLSSGGSLLAIVQSSLCPTYSGSIRQSLLLSPFCDPGLYKRMYLYKPDKKIYILLLEPDYNTANFIFKLQLNKPDLIFNLII